MRTKIVAALLLVLEPLNFAGEALRVLPTIGGRGLLAMLELLLHGGVAALAAGAGLALWNGVPDARRIASVAVVVAFLRVIQSLYWSVLPNDTIPGQEPVLAGAAVLVALMALLLIRAPRQA